MSDPLSIATGLIALIQVTATATAYLKNVKDGGKERTKLRDELRSVTCLLEMLHDRVEDCQREASSETSGDNDLKPAAVASLMGPDGPLERMKATMEEIVAELAPPSRLRRFAQPIKWPFDKKDIMELFATIERLKSHFTFVLQNDLIALSKLTHQKVDLVSKQLDDMNLSRREDEAEMILSWISSTSFQAKQADVLQSVEPGTGKWFLEASSYCDWLSGDLSLLWCPGIPGAGKTRLASLAIESVETLYVDSSNTLAYIYNDYDQRESQTPQALISCILEQALRQKHRSSLPGAITSLYVKHCQQGTRPTLKQLSDVFREIFSACDNVFVVIDALDECFPSDETALEFIDSVMKLGNNIRLLVTSRHSTNFEGYFRDSPRIEIAAQDEDIRLYLETRIPKQSRLAKHIRADSALQEDIIKHISKSAQGMFLVATLNLESLSRKLTRRDVRSSLSTLPKTLDATYEDALARIRTQPEEDVEVAETIILWVLCARRPLSVLELQHMYAMHLLTEDDEIEPMRLEDDDLPPEDIITGVCGGLVVVDGTSQTVRLVHYTAQDYLLRTHDKQLHEPKRELTVVSLRYLQLLNFSDEPGMSDDTMAERLIKFPFLEYAARYWGSEVHDLQLEAIWEPIHSFLTNKSAVGVASEVWSLPRHRFTNWSREFPTDVPAFVLAASFQLPRVLECLLAQGGHNIEGSGSDGETPLIRSARLGHAENTKTLLRLGADIAAADVAGETSIERATLAGHAEVVKSLIDHGGADVNIVTGSAGWSLLMSAVAGGSIDIVQLLVDAGADLNRQTSWGETALSLGSVAGREDIANVLIDAGAFLPLNRASRRATLQAVRKGLSTLASRLTFNGADYGAVVDTGLQKEPVAVGRQLAFIAELDEAAEADEGETGTRPRGEKQRAARESDSDHSDLTETENDLSLAVTLEGIPYRQGFLRRYTLDENLGRGHFAEVFLCHSKITNVAYAVKKSVFDATSSRAAYEGCRNEIKAFNQLRHSNIIGLIDSVVSDAMDALFLVQELAQEGELFNLIVMKGKLSEHETRTVFRQLFSVLDYMHQEGWAHRDIKPENILLCHGLTIKLADFGLAIKLRDQPDQMDCTLCGTPSYVAPEILAPSSSRRYSYPVDVWSAGVVLYVCLCGFPPFSDELTSEDFPYTLSQQIKEGKFDFPSPYWDPVGDPALHLIDSMLVVDAETRFVVGQCLNHPWMLVGATDDFQAAPVGGEQPEKPSQEITLPHHSWLDCIVIGGGSAGLAAAGSLARLNHSSLVFDSGVCRNSKSSHVYGFLGWDHRDGADLRAQARADLVARYPTVQFRDVAVKKLTQPSPGRFQAVDDNDTRYFGRTVILATGVRDVMLDLDGYAECWAKGIFHCLLCHGYEEQGAVCVGVLAIGKAAASPAALHMACSATRLAHHVNIYTDGDESVAAAIRGALGAALAGRSTDKISFETRKISRVRMAERPGGIPSEVVVTLDDGTEKQGGFLTHATACELNGPFSDQLGLNITTTGEIDTKPPFGETSLPGVYVAGDAMTNVLSVVNAALSGSSAGAVAAFKIGLEDSCEAR